MKPDVLSSSLLSVIRSKAKMWEFNVPIDQHMAVPQDPTRLLPLAIGMLGDYAAALARRSSDTAGQLITDFERPFAADFFDSFLKSQSQPTLNTYFKLLGASAFYLWHQPGSALVLIKEIHDESLNEDGGGLENLIRWLLIGPTSTSQIDVSGPYSEYLLEILDLYLRFYETGERVLQIESITQELRTEVREIGTSRHNLLVDLLAAILRKKVANSTWTSLPDYTGISVDAWRETLRRSIAVKELWPAQHLLGKSGVFRGRSAVVQMPTSAGKTKGIELIIRSALLTNRADFAVIVAPFRALCQEISLDLSNAFMFDQVEVNELSSALLMDVDTDRSEDIKTIWVVTPEKLLYVLCQNRELAEHIGLVIFDEGHQFDVASRGVTYELLLTSLRSMLPDQTQRILISAVIANAAAIGEWLNQENLVVDGGNIISTYRSIGFASWKTPLGRIEYVDGTDPERQLFYVPRVISSINLGRKRKERVDRYFPARKEKSKDVALALAFQVVSNGAVAIYCGTKVSAKKVLDRVSSLAERSSIVEIVQRVSDPAEVNRLADLYSLHLGPESSASVCARLGIFSHHSNVPQGLRTAVEYSMRSEKIKMVVCTSTLAQGVNLPVKYLLISTSQQGQDTIKARDFHNLLGRVGRAGMHTEGSVIFTDIEIYDGKEDFDENEKWEKVKYLLDSKRSEPCGSSLLSLFTPFRNALGYYLTKISPLAFIERYCENPDTVVTWFWDIVQELGYGEIREADLLKQIRLRLDLLSAVESFLLFHFDDEGPENSREFCTKLAQSTLAFHLADTETRSQVLYLFSLLAKRIERLAPDLPVRRRYAKTMLGLETMRRIESWLNENMDALLEEASVEGMLELCWPVLSRDIGNRVFVNISSRENLLKCALAWISGDTFESIFEYIHQNNIEIAWGKGFRDVKIDQVVDLCESGLGFEGSRLVGAIRELIIDMEDGSAEWTRQILASLQKRLRYGLLGSTDCYFYERGISDRIVVRSLVQVLQSTDSGELTAMEQLRSRASQVQAEMERFPEYFRIRVSELINS